MVISRLYNFDDLTVREKTKFNAELNNIINFLNGTSTNQLYIQHTDISEPVLTLSQLASGKVVDFCASGSSVAFIDKNGSLNTLYNSGAPFDIGSNTTKCTGLNVGFLDGINTENFNSNNLPEQFFTANLQITKASGTQSIKGSQDADTFKLQRTSDSQSLLEIQDMDENVRILSLPSTTNLQVNYEPNLANDVLRYADLRGNLLPQLRHTQYVVSPSLNDYIFSYICPCKVSGVIFIKKLGILSKTTGDTATVEFFKNGVSLGTLSIATATVSLTRVVMSVNIPMVENDVIYAKLTAVSGITGLACFLTGTL